MSPNKIAVICDGKEISYGLNLFHLFKYKSAEECFISSKFDELSIEMYSAIAFRHANISKKTIRIYVGKVQNIDSSYKKVFNQFGMEIYQNENSYVLKSDDKRLNCYSNFISYANEKRREYIELEKDYFDRVVSLDKNWIVGEFVQANSGRVFRKENTKVQQLYDCLAFVVYINFLKNTKE